MDPTTAEDTLLPRHFSILQTERRADLHDTRKLLVLGFGKLRQGNGKRDGTVG